MNSVESSVIRLCIADEFSKTPGPRTRAEGKNSAEDFVAKLLLQRFDLAVVEGKKLLVDLDGGFGYGTSFLEESFGGLARLRTVQKVLDHIQFKSDEEPYLCDEIDRYIKEAITGSPRRS